MTSEINLLLLVVAAFGILFGAVATALALRFYRISMEWKRKASTKNWIPVAPTSNDTTTATLQSTTGLTLRSHASLLRKRGVGSFSYWPATKTLMVDAGTLNLLGLPAVDEGGVLSLDVFLGALEPANRDPVRQALTAPPAPNGKSDSTELRFSPLRQEAAARRIAMSLEAVGPTSSEPAHVAVFVWDVSGSNQTENDLAITNERLQLALAATRIGLISLDAETSQIWLDATASRLFHLDAEEFSANPKRDQQVIFGTWLSRVNSADRTDLIKSLTAREHIREAFRRRITLHDGITHLQLVAHRRRAQAEGTSWLGVVWNVTAEVEREHALTVAREQAQAANTAKSRFLASMSHEIRTPLNAILGFSQLLSRDFTLSDAQREQLLTVNQSGRKLLGLLNDVLDMAKVETGGAALAEETADLAGIAHEIRKVYWPQAKAKALRLELNVARDLPSLLVFDVNRFRQIMNHLLLNSLQYTETGSIAIDIGAESTFDGKYCVTVKLSNTGPGISKEAQEGIFRPFERGDEAVESGTGLGLSISRDLARLLRGDLTVDSDGIQGATFTLTFMAGSATQSDRFSVPRVSKLAQDSPAVSVLVVDDRESNRELLSAMLEKVGISVLLAKSGAHALELLTTNRPNIALLDLKMPEMSGFEVAKRVKADPRSAHIPLIAVSASAQDFGSEPGSELFADFAFKPVNMDEIIGLISKHGAVRFAYEPNGTPPTNVAANVAKTLATLTIANRPQLCDALECLDYNRFVTLLDQTPELPVAAREHLRGLASRFDNETLLSLLRQP